MAYSSGIGTRDATIARQLRKIRQEQGVTIRELSIRSGISKATIGAIECGRNMNPTQQTVAALARALKVSVSALMFDTELRLSEPGKPEAASIPLRHLKPEEIGLLDALKLKNPAIFSYVLRLNSLTEAQQDSIHEYIAQFFHVEEDT